VALAVEAAEAKLMSKQNLLDSLQTKLQEESTLRSLTQEEVSNKEKRRERL